MHKKIKGPFGSYLSQIIVLIANNGCFYKQRNKS